MLIQRNPIPLKVLAQHRHYFSVMRRSAGTKRLVMQAFLALVAFNAIYFLVEPVHALVYDDLTGLGRQIAGGIIASSNQIIQDTYTGKNGIWPWLCRTCLWLCTPIAAVGIMQWISDTDDRDGALGKGVVWGSIILTICLSGGGWIGGQLYLFVDGVSQGIISQMDDF